MAKDARRDALASLAFLPTGAGELPRQAEPESSYQPPSPPQQPAPELRQRTSISMPKGVFRRLKEIGLHTEKNVNDLLLEAVDDFLAKNGYSERSIK